MTLREAIEDALIAELEISDLPEAFAIQLPLYQPSPPRMVLVISGHTITIDFVVRPNE